MMTQLPSIGRRGFFTGAASLAVSLAAARMSHAAPVSEPFKSPLIIGHRGAPGYMPEHTQGSYEEAIRRGADFVEPDVVATKDGHLVTRHDPVLTDSTDILAHPEFAARKRTVKFAGGFEITDFFVADFTLAELKTLRCKQVMPGRDHSRDGQYPILTLEEMIDIVQAGAKKAGRAVGIYPEIKFPSFHRSLGLPIEDHLLDVLGKAGYTGASSPVFIQSFEQGNLQYLKTKTDIRLMQLVDGSGTDPDTGAMQFKPPSDKPYDWTLAGKAGTYGDLLTPAGLDEVAKYATIIAPWKRHLLAFKKGSDGKPIPVVRKEIVDNAHARGLKVHIWTMRNDAPYLDPYYNGDPIAEFLDFFRMGVDGVFTDFADTGVAAREAFLKERAG
ncbi:glycerophosphodiester phosphodiesterase [Asticcacaulis solisilvae]|uniref:glycerophosphodiester phosphodiesterase n=1 Tax=Asticcacaulis solisilvae TaxID=1217274 RepID=UPI003FD77699